MERTHRRRVYQAQADICKALANPTRLEIIHLIADRDVSFGELHAALRISKPNLSQQLAVLRKARIVADRRRDGLSYYRLAYPEIATACQAVQRALTRHLREVGRQVRVLLRRVS